MDLDTPDSSQTLSALSQEQTQLLFELKRRLAPVEEEKVRKLARIEEEGPTRQRQRPDGKRKGKNRDGKISISV